MDNDIIMRILAEDDASPVFDVTKAQLQDLIGKMLELGVSAQGTAAPIEASTAALDAQAAALLQAAQAAGVYVQSANTINEANAQRALKTGAVTQADLDMVAAMGGDTEAFAALRLAQQADIDSRVAASAVIAEENTMLGANAAATRAASDEEVIYARSHLGLLSAGEGLNAGQALLAAGVLAVGAAFVTVANEASQWQEQMVLLQNNTGASNQTIGQMSTAILNLGQSIGANSTQLADGARRILDYGFQGADAINILNASAKVAVATGANEADVAQAVAQALHQYGASASEAQQYVSILMVESQRANSTLGDFADNLKRVSGLAAGVGVPFDQVTSAVSALTRELGTDAQAQTQLLGILRFILEPTKAEAAAWDDLSQKSGIAEISSQNLANTLSTKGLTGILNDVHQAMGDVNTQQIAYAKESFDLINAQRGGLGMFILLTGAAKDYQDGLTAASKATGDNSVEQTALNNQLNTAQNAWDRLGGTLHQATAEQTTFANGSRTVADALNQSAQGWGDLLQQQTKVFDTSHDWDNFTETIKRLGDAVTGQHDGWQIFFDDMSKSYDEIHNTDAGMASASHTASELADTIDSLPSPIDKYGEAAITAAQDTQQLTESFTVAGKAARDFGSQFSDAMSGAAVTADKEAKDAASAIQEGYKNGFAQTIANTEQQIADLKQRIDIEKEAGQEATAAGVAWKDNWQGQLAVADQNTLTEMNAILGLLNKFSQSAAQAGYDAGNAWATNYEAQIAAATANRQPGFSPGAPNYTGTGSGELFALPYNQPGKFAAGGVPVIDNPSTMTLNEEAAAREAIPKDKGRGHGGQSPDQIGSNLAQAQQKYELDLKQLELQLQLTAATEKLKDATDAKNKVDHDADAALRQINVDLEKNAQAEQNDPKLNAAKAKEASVEGQAASVAKADAAAANDLDVKIHDVEGQLKELDREAAEAMAPLKQKLEDDTAAMNDLEKATEKADLAFQHQIESIQEQEYELEQSEKQIEGPLIDAVNQWQAKVEEDSEAVQAQQDVVSHLQDIEQEHADFYAKELAPIEAKLTDLQDKRTAVEQKLTDIQNERTNAQMADKLEQEGQAIANLTARLKDHNLTAAERAQLEEQLSKSKRDLGLDQQQDSLTKQDQALQKQQDALKKEEEAIQKAADAQRKADEEAIKAAEKVLKAKQEIQKEDEKQLKQAQEALKAQQDLYAKQKANLDEQMQNIQHEQTLYDEQQRDKKVAQQDQLDADNAAIKSAQAVADARAAADKAYLAELQNEQWEQQFTAQQDSYKWANAVQDAKNAVAELEKPYNDIKTGLDNQANAIKAVKDEWDNDTQPIIDHLTDIKNSSQDVLDTFNANKDLVNTVQQFWDAQTKAGDALSKVKDGAPVVSQSIKDLASNMDLAHTPTTQLAKDLGINLGDGGLQDAVANTSDTIKNIFGPAAADLATVALPGLESLSGSFYGVFGSPTDPNFDPSKSISWLVSTHNPDGFPAKWMTEWKILLGPQGIQGVFDQNMPLIQADVDGILDQWKTDFNTRGNTIGQSLGDGIVAGINSKLSSLTYTISLNYNGGGANPANPTNPPIPTSPIGGNYVGGFGSMAVPVGYLGGNQTHNNNQTYNLSFPNVTKLPTDVSSWIEVMKPLEAAMKIYDRIG